MKQLGATDIISVSAVGSLKENLEPGKFVIVDQFIDRTFARVKTFFNEEIVAHVSMAKPTSHGLSNCCEAALKKLNINYQFGGTYIVMEGPQFSTLAESNLYRSWGADVIGMTNMPEAKLAREAEIRYCTIAMVTDYDCWHPDHDEVDVNMVVQTLMKNAANAQNMIKEIIKTFKNFSVEKDPANDCLDVAIITDPKLRTKKTIKKLKNIAGRILNKKIISMPTYTVKYSNINLSQKQKNSIASDITNTHSKFTGANAFFAQVIFQKNKKGAHFMGGQLVKTKEIFLNGQIRAGRTSKVKKQLILGLRKF